MDFLFFKASSELKEQGQLATQKYQGIFNITLKGSYVDGQAELSMMASRGQLHGGEIWFISDTCKIEDVRSVFSIWVEQKKRPLIVANSTLHGYLINECTVPTQKERIIAQIEPYSTRYIFNCLRSVFTSGERKLDLRVAKSMMIALREVLQHFIGESTPQQVSEARSESNHGEAISVGAFYGDGICGSIELRLSQDLLKKSFIKMIASGGNSEGEVKVSQADLSDFTGELVTQVWDRVYHGLKEFEYDLVKGAQVTVFGGHQGYNKSSGKYYVMPFKHEDSIIELVLCYDFYTEKIRNLADKKQSQGVTVMSDDTTASKSHLDVRLIKSLIWGLQSIFKDNYGLDLVLISISNTPAITETLALAVIHGRGPGGGYSSFLSMNKEACEAIFKASMGMTLPDMDSLGVSDLLSEVANMLRGKLKQDATNLGYTYNNILHSSYCADKNPENLFEQEGYFKNIVAESRGVGGQIHVNFALGNEGGFMTMKIAIDSIEAAREYDFAPLFYNSLALSFQNGQILSGESGLAAAAKAGIDKLTRTAEAPVQAGEAKNSADDFLF